MLLGQDTARASSGPSPFYNALCNVLADYGVRRNISYDQFLQTAAGKAWPQAERDLMGFIQVELDFKRRSVEESALASKMITLVCEDLRRREIPVSFRAVVVNIQRMPSIFDDAFPNYLANGLASIIPSLILKPNVNLTSALT